MGTHLSSSFFLAGPSSSLNPPGDPWSTAEMPREDRATWKSNYFMKIIVSVDSEPSWGTAAAGACSGQREPGGPGCGVLLREIDECYGVS